MPSVKKIALCLDYADQDGKMPDECRDCVRRDIPDAPKTPWQYAPVHKDGICPSKLEKTE